MSGDGFLGRTGRIDFRTGPHAAVVGPGAPYAGGALNKAGTPTAVSGGFTLVSAGGGTPPNVSASDIITARNNSGSNVRVPLMRLCPLHNKDRLPVDDPGISALHETQRVPEYAGLAAGQLAWVLGKAFKPTTNADIGTTAIDFAAYHTNLPRGAPPYAAVQGSIDPSRAYKGRENDAPMGFGVDRMQRLAYTNWMEALFHRHIGNQVLSLSDFELSDEGPKILDSELEFYAGFLHDATPLCLPDLAHMLQKPTASHPHTGQVPHMQKQGLFLMEKGPFLRSMGVEDEPVDLAVPMLTSGNVQRDFSVSRHLGGDLAQRGLYTLLKMNGVFNWVPAGIVLSKLETGPNPQADAETDARQSQLFNLAVQGPAITSTWCGDSRKQAQPMDRVFILVTGVVSYSVSKKAADLRYVQDAKAFTEAVQTQTMDLTATSETKKVRDALNAIDTAKAATLKPGAPADTPYMHAYNAYQTAISNYETERRKPNTDPAQKAATDAAETAARNALYASQAVRGDGELGKVPRGAVLGTSGTFDDFAGNLRTGASAITKAEITNLRLLRATSSWLINCSRPINDKNNSRLGLGIGFTVDPTDARQGSGAATYVLGGWCIGTVLDSAASRAATHNSGVRTAPASRAMNVNVNIEWWSADKLHKHYNDPADLYERIPAPAVTTPPTAPDAGYVDGAPAPAPWQAGVLARSEGTPVGARVKTTGVNTDENASWS